MAFEAFERKRSHGGDPSVTITRFGNFVLNSTCIEKFFKDAKYAKLYWDADHQKVGIKPMPKKDQYSYSINYSPKGSVGTFSGVSFFKAVGIDNKNTKSYPASWNEKEGLVEFSVKGEVRATRTGRE